jgi:probable rRNA maturation factor
MRLSRHNSLNMTLQLYNTTKQDIPEELLQRAVILVLADEGFSVESISGIYCGNRMIRRINREFLQHDYPTDTITFRYNHGREIDGEFYISLDVVRDNASRFNVDFQQELLRVTLHSALHLAGFGDTTDAERHSMQEKEAHYLELLNESL